MRFRLIDAVLDVGRDEHGRAVRASAIKHVSAAEEYLGDHFAGFPILPGVFMLEALVQTARLVADARDADAGGESAGLPWVLGTVRAMKYGRFVPPGSTLRLEVELAKLGEDGTLEFKGTGSVRGPGEGADGETATAVSGRFSLRRARV